MLVRECEDGAVNLLALNILLNILENKRVYNYMRSILH